jgi:cytochrome c oxidase subunit 1/cytochrome c oxidase subunit I+III
LFSLFLIASSVTLWQAERALHRARQSRFLGWLAVTIGLGIVFLIGQAFEYANLIGSGITVSHNLFASTFFTVTGFHGFHVMAGLIVLAILLALGASRDLTARRAYVLKAAGLYWHFVDVVWIAVFGVIYLGWFQ